jgi:glucan-binding YG repeat protein
LFGSALNALVETMQKQNPDISSEQVGKIVDLVSGGDVPVNLAEEDYIPQIIKFDVENETTEVIYQPRTAIGEDGRLYYTDKDGKILPDSDVASETASFRSVIEYKGNLYFGSLGTNMLQLVRVDEEDKASVVFQTIGLVSSLRACAKYDAGEGETVYFGGQDTTYLPWRQYRQSHPGEASPLPIVIRYLDPKTAGSDEEDWSNLIADFNDFGKYAYATVYSAGGGNVWDLCDYNGKLYLILAYDGGWALFRGEKGGEKPNQFGWTWTEIVGDDGKYPLAMNEEVADLNEQYRIDYGCGEYAANLTGSGLLESTATPYVYNGKMYIGSFDNATVIQSQTVIKVIAKLAALRTGMETGDFGPTLAQIYAPIYEVLSHPQHVYVMDEEENIVPVDSINELLEGTTNDYVWRFIEHDGKLFTGTFDSSTAYNYFVDVSLSRVLSLLRELGQLPPQVEDLMEGNFSKQLKPGNLSSNSIQGKTVSAAYDTAVCLEAFLQDEASVEELLDQRLALEAAMAASPASYTLNAVNETQDVADDLIAFLANLLDLEGLQYWAKAKKLIEWADKGFDLFVSRDGEQFEVICQDGGWDPYNYGARTFAVCNDELYLGTANPYYGAQLWKVVEKDVSPYYDDPQLIEGLVYDGNEKELVTAGECYDGTIVYSLGTEDEPGEYSEQIPLAENAGTYYVWYKVLAEGIYSDSADYMVEVTIEKAMPDYEIPPEFTATFGQTLADLQLPQGWYWKDSSASVGKVGTKKFPACFTPEDQDNYKIVEEKVSVKVLADKEALKEATEEAETFCQEHPADELAMLIEQAKQILADENASQAKVDEMTEKLKALLGEAKDDAAYTGFKLEDGTKIKLVNYNENLYWYENDVRQGVYGDPLNIFDKQFEKVERGREIHDPSSKAWYWLDACYEGAVAKNKEVWMPYVFQEEEIGSTQGKWVRYDKYGRMIKGWYVNDQGTYYYDKITGQMYHGEQEIDGETYVFDDVTGIMK